MTDPIFQAPPVQAPNFNQPTGTNSPSQTPETVATPAPASVPETPVVENASPVETKTEEVITAQNQNAEQTSEKQNPTQEKMDELRQKLSKIDLTEIKEKIQKKLWAVLGGCFLIGMMFGCSMSGGEEQPQQSHGLELRAITKQNSDIKSQLYRCGRTKQLSDACVYYIMNFEHYDKKAEDFFNEVADKTNRQLFRIQTENPTYGQQLIPPGYFAQIIVPSLN